MFSPFIVKFGLIVAFMGLNVAVWSILDRLSRDREKAVAETAISHRHTGMAIAAATIDHILENGTDLEEMTERISVITSQWAAYDIGAYNGQKNSFQCPYCT